MTVSYEIPWRKGAYLARLDGEHPKYGLDRTFESGTPVKGAGVLKYELEAGWYEWRGQYHGGKRYVAVDELDAREIRNESAIAAMDKISAGANPGANGAWDGTRCKCGDDATDFDGIGFPYCSVHVPVLEASRSDSLPVPA